MLQIQVDTAYRQQVAVLQEKLKKKKYQLLFDVQAVSQFSFSATEDDITICYEMDGIQHRKHYAYQQINICQVRMDGCLIRFKEKTFVFLPNGKDAEYSSQLLSILDVLHQNCTGLQFAVTGRLRDSDGKRVNFDPADSPVLMFVGAILAIAMALVFFLPMRQQYAPISIKEAEVYTGGYGYYEEDEQYSMLYFDNGEGVLFHYTCMSTDVLQRLNALEKGTTITVWVNPQHEYLIAIKAGEKEILNEAYAQQQMEREGKGFWWLGIVLLGSGVYIIIYALIRIKRERSRKR